MDYTMSHAIDPERTNAGSYLHDTVETYHFANAKVGYSLPPITYKGGATRPPSSHHHRHAHRRGRAQHDTVQAYTGADMPPHHSEATNFYTRLHCAKPRPGHCRRRNPPRRPS